MKAGGWLRAAAAFALLAAAGCDDGKGRSGADGGVDDGRWWEEGTESERPSGESLSDEALGALAADAQRVLVNHCAPCHAGEGNAAEGGFGEVLDANALFNLGLVVPGDINGSRLYQRIATGEMPPPGAADPADPSRAVGPVSPDDLAAIARWIDAGIPPFPPARAPLAGAALRELMAADAATLPPADLPFYRYVSLSALHGSRDVDGQALSEIVSAASMLLSALSPSRAEPARPELLLAADYEPIALRVDLRDYELDAADWARLEAASEVVDRQAFACRVPFLGVEQLFSLALSDHHVRADGAVESVYANIVLRRALERAGVLAPGQLVFEPRPAGPADEPLVSAVTLPELALALGVDLEANLAPGGTGATRFCKVSPSSDDVPNCVQRDAMPGAPGRGFWWTMHYASGEDGLPSSPVGPSNGGLAPAPEGVEPFALTEGQAFWPWANGTPGFTLFDEQLRLRSNTPKHSFNIDVPGSEYEFATCATCHARGPFYVVDELASVVLSEPNPSGPFTQGEIDFVNQIFQPGTDPSGTLIGDQNAFAAAEVGACIRRCGQPDSAVALASASSFRALFFETLTSDRAAARLYLAPENFASMVATDPEVGLIFAGVESISQATFVASFDALRRAAIARGVDAAALNFCAVP
jgi:mono/diheme cytochrome c family protein